MHFTIAIDGPVGAGKSSVAQDLAAKLNVLHLDTGAMYRALAYQAIHEKIPLDNEKALSGLCGRSMPEVRFENGSQLTFIDQKNVTDLIRTPEVSMAASSVAKVSCVRTAMVKAQQKLAQTQSMIVDGRDIGTRVLPDATLKIFLTASAQIRAKRRCDEMLSKGQTADFATVLEDVIARDRQDSERNVDPLRMAEDALLLDTSHLSQLQAVDSIHRMLEMRLGHTLPREEKPTGMYCFLYNLVRVAKKSFLPYTVHNGEYGQLDAPYMLIANHNSVLDPIFLVNSAHRYPIHFLGKKELVQSKIGQWFFEKQLLMIPVDRGNTDMAAMRKCVKILRDKKVLGVFPEGTRFKNGLMEQMETGTAMIALLSKKPLLPVYLTERPRLFRRAHVYYSSPIWPDDICPGTVNTESCEKLMNYITGIYQELHNQAEKDHVKCIHK